MEWHYGTLLIQGEHGQSQHGGRRSPRRRHPNLTLQGFDLSVLVFARDSDCVPEDGSVKDNPVLQCLDRLSQLNCSQNRQTEDELVDLLVKFTELCNSKGSGNAAIASRNGVGCEQAVVLALRALASLQHDLQSREAFRIRGGPSILVVMVLLLLLRLQQVNEVIKELFMELKIDELILRVLSVKREVSIESLYDAIQVLFNT
ncbi:unnamed protein product [Malus baccata var. baccata]